MRPPVGAVILCAGASERMGFSKLLLDVGGRPAAGLMAETALHHLGGPAVLVVRPEDSGCGALPPSERVSAVVNPTPDLGRTGSIQCGLRALESSQIMGCLIWPVDLPLVQGETVRRVALELASAGAEGRVVPTHPVPGGPSVRGGSAVRGGHPVAIGRAWWPHVQAMNQDEPLRRLFARPGPDVLRVAVDDRFIHADLNAPEDVERWLGCEAKPWSDAE